MIFTDVSGLQLLTIRGILAFCNRRLDLNLLFENWFETPFALLMGLLWICTMLHCKEVDARPAPAVNKYQECCWKTGNRYLIIPPKGKGMEKSALWYRNERV